MTKYFLICLTTILSFLSVNAQQPAACGTSITASDMQTFYNRDKTHLFKGTNAIVHIPVTYHLVADDNGDGAFTLSETFRLHCSLVEDFAPSEVIFYIHDIVYHNSDYYFYMEDGQAGNSMFNNENVENTCNIFIVEEAKSGSNPVCGYSYLASYGFFLNGNGIMLDKGCSGAGSTTLTHEMGHYLNLPHTFSGWENQDYFGTNNVQNWERERVNGSNCTTTGDGFCDTPPDYLSSRWDCNSFATLTDPNGQTFTADEKNYMSYSEDVCMEYFKPEQQSEVNAAPASYRPYLLTLSVPDMTPVAVANTIFPADNESNLSNNSITFTWSASPDAEGYLVEFTQGNFFNILRSELVTTNSLTLTDLDPNATYQWRVKAFKYSNVCTDYSSEKTFSTAAYTTTANVIDVFCPGDENGTVTINGTSAGASYTLYENSTSGAFTQIAASSSNTFNNLAPNSYKVKVVNSNGQESNVFFSVSDAEPLNIQLNALSNSISSNISGGSLPYTYTWSNGENGVTNNSPNNGENSLYITDGNGCFKSASIIYDDSSIDPTSAINKLNVLNFNLYPNPIVGDYLNVEFSLQTNTKPTIEMYSISGKKIVAKQISGNSGLFSESLNVSSHSKGVYFIKINVGTDSITRKVIL